jgi:TonB family protein
VKDSIKKVKSTIMKQVLNLFLLLCSLFANAQNYSSDNQAETYPSFPGCSSIEEAAERQACSDKKMLSFLAQNTIYPKAAMEAKIEGKVFISFAVEIDGTISNVEVLKDQTAGGGLAAAAIEAVNAMNSMQKKWTPGTKSGQPVRVKVVVPITFRLNNGRESAKNN